MTLERPPKIFGALRPLTSYLLLHFSERIFVNFRNLEFYVDWFFRKATKIFWKISWDFSTFPKVKKTIIVVSKLVRNHYIDQNLAKFFHRTKKTSRFFLKNLNFSKFSAPPASKIWSFMYQKRDFFGVWSLHGPGPP